MSDETLRDTTTGGHPAGGPAALLDAVVIANQMINSMTALRSELIEAVRAASLDPDDDAMDPDSAASREMDLRDMVAELACALHLPEATTAHLVEESHVLAADLPATAAALRDGVISYRHASIMIDYLGDMEPAARSQAERTLLPKARLLTAAKFARWARRERNRLDPVPQVVRHERAASNRRVYLEPDLDGMSWLHALLPAVAATAAFHRLSDAAASLQHPSDGRTLPQLRADALTALLLDDDARDALNQALGGDHACPCAQSGLASTAGGSRTSTAGGSRTSTAGGSCTSTASGSSTDADDAADVDARTRLMRRTLRGIRPSVAVTVPVMTLLGGDAPAELEGYGPIDPSTARELCAGAPSFLRILTHPHSGAVLGVDRDRYVVPGDLKAWLRLRDETCRFPGCSRRARRCDLDHVTAWAAGGSTDQTNLIHLCRKHHRLKHHTRWRADVTTHPVPEGPHTGPVGARVCWTAPSGRTYTTSDALPGYASANGPPTDPRDTTDSGGNAGADSPRPEAPGSHPPPGRSTFPDIPPF